MQFDGDINILGSQVAVSEIPTPLEQPGSGQKIEHNNDTFAEPDTPKIGNEPDEKFDFKLLSDSSFDGHLAIA